MPYVDPTLPDPPIMTRKQLNIWIENVRYLAQEIGIAEVDAVAIAGVPDGIEYVRLNEGEILYRGASGITKLALPEGPTLYWLTESADGYPIWAEPSAAEGRINEALRWGV